MKGKKGELTSKQLITIIILIISFAIILIFFLMFPWKQEITRETCTNSIVLRSKVPDLLKGASGLKCESQDVCINLGGECSGVRENVENIRIENVEKINEKLNELKLDCFGMVGEGKVKYGKNGECGLCHLIYFDDKVQQEVGEISIDGQQLRTDKPIAIIAYSQDIVDRYSKIIFSQYTSDELKKTKCNNYLFV